MGSVQGFTHPWESVQHRLWWERALQDWAAQRFFDVTFINMDRSPVLCIVRTCRQAPRAHSLLGRKGGPGQRSSEEVSCGLVLPAVTLGMFCFLPGPLTFQEDIGSESFQEVFLLL